MKYRDYMSGPGIKVIMKWIGWFGKEDHLTNWNPRSSSISELFESRSDKLNKNTQGIRDDGWRVAKMKTRKRIED